MQKPELISGIKNAIAKGYSLEQAKRSFINAGYNSADVEDSARSFSGVISNLPQRIMPSILQQNQQKPIFNQQPSQSIQQLAQSMPPIQQQKNTKKTFWIIVTIILALILLVLFGFLIMEIFFREKLIALLPFLERFG